MSNCNLTAQTPSTTQKSLCLDAASLVLTKLLKGVERRMNFSSASVALSESGPVIIKPILPSKFRLTRLYELSWKEAAGRGENLLQLTTLWSGWQSIGRSASQQKLQVLTRTFCSTLISSISAKNSTWFLTREALVQ